MGIHYLNKALEALHHKAQEFIKLAKGPTLKGAAGYNIAYLEGRDPFPAKVVDFYLDPLLSYLRQYAGQGTRLLEIGAGTGRFTIPLAQAGYYVDAVEPAAPGLETIERKAREQGCVDRVKAFCGSFDDLSYFEDGSYAACIATQSIMYCESKDVIRKRVAECIRVTNSVLVFDVISKYGYLLAGATDVPSTLENISYIYTKGKMPGIQTLRSENFCLLSYGELKELASFPDLVVDEIIPICFSEVMGNRLSHKDALAVETVFRKDELMKDMSIFLLVLAHKELNSGPAQS